MTLWLQAVQAAGEKKDCNLSNERRGSNEPLLPVEVLLATVLSNESLPEAVQQLSAGAEDSLKAISASTHQASVQDLEKQHQNMAAAQEQVGAPLDSVRALLTELEKNSTPRSSISYLTSLTGPVLTGNQVA